MTDFGDTKAANDSPRQHEQSPSNGADADPDIGANVSQAEVDEAAEEELAEKLRREREARAQALTLEIVGDLPYAEVKPPENVLFVCKLNPVTEDEDLDLIFSRFGKILSCEVIRDKRTGDSLQYAFIEFEDQKACEQAYFKMQGVLIDDHRIHVDFSQSVRFIVPHTTLHRLISPRFQGFQIPGGKQRIQSALNKLADLAALRVWRRSDSTEPWTTRGKKAAMATIWSWTRMIYEIGDIRKSTNRRIVAGSREVAAQEEEIITESGGHHEGTTDTEGVEAGIRVWMIIVMIEDVTKGIEDDVPGW
ncbi:MAG: hypothetical protein Q9225_000445 [Loekoesia sp. 1 TL-2023]